MDSKEKKEKRATLSPPITDRRGRLHRIARFLRCRGHSPRPTNLSIDRCCCPTAAHPWRGRLQPPYRHYRLHHGSDAWSAARKTSASDASRPNIHLLLTAIAGSTPGDGAAARLRHHPWPLASRNRPSPLCSASHGRKLKNDCCKLTFQMFQVF
jgi:hypothetical protein